MWVEVFSLYSLWRVNCLHQKVSCIIVPPKFVTHRKWVDGWLSKNILYEFSSVKSWNSRFSNSYLSINTGVIIKKTKHDAFMFKQGTFFNKRVVVIRSIQTARTNATSYELLQCHSRPATDYVATRLRHRWRATETFSIWTRSNCTID